MCGIAGIFNQGESTPIEISEIERMVSTMPHRGPDANGAKIYDGNLGLGHARLAILDLSPEANQPFESDDGALSITYNGEIFNFVELREELKGVGRVFHTSCDTEVLLQAYAEWGDEFVHRLNGMWAFAIYDRRRERLFCSRDRFGIKPFAFTVHAGRFLFASEIKAILAVAPELAKPDYDGIAMVLRSSRGFRKQDTCFKEIHRLPPAHNLIATSSGIKVQRYWDYPEDMYHSITDEEAAERVREILLDAVKIRMRSDVPVGACLSSGVDSSAIVCLLRDFFDGPFETFTADYEGESFDESGAAQKLGKSLNMNVNLVPAVATEFIPSLRQCIYHLEMPERSAAVLPLWNIMKTARTKVTCLLDGQGADELLGGYAHCFPYAAWDRLSRGQVLAACREIRVQSRNIGAMSALFWLARTLVPAGQRIFTAYRGDASVFAGHLDMPLPKLTGREDSPPRIADTLGDQLRLQHEGSLVALLHYGDAISMAHSIESRMPFMDYRLVEFAFRLPGRIKFREGVGKAVLRDAVRNDVPAEILAPKRKLAFQTPISRWFRDEPERTVHPVLFSETCRKRGIFDQANLKRALDRHASGKVDLSQQIYRWITTELWFQEFIDAR